jgi:hypothetical protein
MTKDDITVDFILKKRRDLERRLLIDLRQFEEDTGVQLESIQMVHTGRVGHRIDALVDVVVKLEFPR